MVGRCRPYWRPYLMGAVALFVVDGLDASGPQIVRWAIDHLVRVTSGNGAVAVGPDSPLAARLPAAWFGPDAFMHGMWVYGLAMVLIVAVTGFFRYFMSMGFAIGGITLSNDLRKLLFGHVQRLSATYHDRTKAGDLMNLATSDINALREFYWIGLWIGLDTLCYFVFVPAYMAGISGKLLLASLLTLPLIPFIVTRLAGRIEDRYEKMQSQLDTMSERARESFSGAKVVKSFAREEGEVKTFAKMGQEYRRRAMRLCFVEALEQPLLVLMLALADLVIVGYGGVFVLRGLEIQRALAAQGAGAAEIEAAVQAAGALTVGGFVAFFSYLIRLSGPMVGLGWVVSIYLRGRVSMDRIEVVLHTKPDITDPADPVPVTELRGEIEFRNLTFTYPGRKPAEAAAGDSPTPPLTPSLALTGISLRVPAGKTVALVGAVGSGKSTLLNLIPRLYDPPAGTVFVDGHDVRDLPLGLLRTQVGTVPQETFLFSETILENIGVGTTGTTHANAEPITHYQEPPPRGAEAWLRDCAKLAHLDEDVNAFPKGYATMLGEKGVNLSGGQRQRVAIARAIARRPRILLLDDCLSAVDPHTEARLLGNLQEIMAGRTTLIVSHRLSSVEQADEIIVLDAGRIAERGTHAELLSLGQRYAELWEKQQLEQEVEETS